MKLMKQWFSQEKEKIKPLSIVIYGNTNNTSLLLACGLKKLGYNVRLIVNRKEILHRPEGLYPQWRDNYPDWITDHSDMSDVDIAYQTPAIDPVLHLLTYGIDLAILNDNGLALTEYLRCPHVAFLTGSDLSYWANFDMVRDRIAETDTEFRRSLQGRRYQEKFIDLVSRQRDGILGAKVVCSPHRGLIPSRDAMLDELAVTDRRWFACHFANTIDLIPQAPPKNKHLTLLNGARIVFRPDLNPQMEPLDFKGTDVLLNGFAQYVKAGGKGQLKMIRKGQDLDVAYELIEELGIQMNVRWLDEMPLAQFYQEMATADLVCDQFGSSCFGGVTLDAYALGKPVMVKLRNDVFGRRFPEPFPGFDASTPAEIANHLHAMERDSQLLIDMGKKERAFAEAYLSPEAMAKALIKKIESLD